MHAYLHCTSCFPCQYKVMTTSLLGLINHVNFVLIQMMKKTDDLQRHISKLTVIPEDGLDTLKLRKFDEHSNKCLTLIVSTLQTKCLDSTTY